MSGTLEVRGRFEAKQAAIVAKACAFPAGERYPVIYADPPWRFEPYSRETGMDRSADTHYETMTIEEICTHVWATMPMLPAALQVIEAWGFVHRSGFAWVKEASPRRPL